MLKSPEQTINWQCSQCHTGIVGPRPDECEYCGGLLEALDTKVVGKDKDATHRYAPLARTRPLPLFLGVEL